MHGGETISTLLDGLHILRDVAATFGDFGEVFLDLFEVSTRGISIGGGKNVHCLLSSAPSVP